MADNTDLPAPTPTQRQVFAPTGNNAATSFGGAVGVLFIIYEHVHGVDFPAGYEGTIAVAFATIFGYFHSIVASLVERFAPESHK